jgi:hypothetical protein
MSHCSIGANHFPRIDSSISNKLFGIATALLFVCEFGFANQSQRSSSHLLVSSAQSNDLVLFS